MATIRSILFFILILSLSVPLLSEAASSWGNVSSGKFYIYSITPDPRYPDVGASYVNNSAFLTHGTKLTDGVFESDWHLSQSVGWTVQNFDVTLDLGKVYAISDIHLSADSLLSFAISLPSAVDIKTSTDGITWSVYAANLHFGANSEYITTAEVSASQWANARFVKYSITAAPPVNGVAQWTFLDEIWVNGSIPNQAKGLPTNNEVYHGAYAVDDAGNLNFGTIQNFVTKAGKDLASVLWYGDFSHDYLDPNGGLGSVINGTSKTVQLGWEPRNGSTPIPLSDINIGKWDQYLYTWFVQAQGQGAHPLFLRFASEMNGNWTSWGGAANGGNAAAAAAYVAMWRRVYNIAERAANDLNTPTKLSFVWAVNFVSIPTATWNSVASYYPGDAYVDWVGIDLCNNCSLPYCTVTHANDPASWISPIYQAYGANKPLMLAETGGLRENDNVSQSQSLCPSADANGNNQAQFITSLFNAIEGQFPQVRALFWWDHADATGDYRLCPGGAGLSTYRSRISNSRYTSVISGM